MFDRSTVRALRGITAALLIATPVAAQERVDQAAIDKIKSEALDRSQVMETASWLTDVYGARLTGSPNIKAAGEWAAKKLTEWGMVNAKLEPWGYFGRGWTNDRLSLHVIAPTPWPVIAYAAAWTPGTNGTVTGEVVRVEADSAADLQQYRGKLRNAFVMLAPARHLAPKFMPDAERYRQAELDSMAALGPQPARGGGGGRGGRGGGRGGAGGPSFTQIRAEFLANEGVAAILQPGSGDSTRGTMGTVFTTATGSRDPRNPTRTLTLLLAPEHYNRISRIVEKGQPVRMEANVKNTFYDQDHRSATPGRTRHARRALRFLARRHGCNGQRRWIGGDDGSTADPEGHRPAHEADSADRALDGRGERLVRQPRLRAEPLRHSR